MNISQIIDDQVSPAARPLRGIRAGGFTLMETLVALGVFVIGFTAVASLLPVGTVLQRNAITDVQTHTTAQAAINLLQGRGVAEADLATAAPHTRVQALPGPAMNRWPTNLRRGESRMFWYPLIRRNQAGADTDPSQWTGYVFILERHMRDGTEVMSTPVPVVQLNASAAADGGEVIFNYTPNAAVTIRVGDPFLDSTGRIHRVARIIEPNRLAVVSPGMVPGEVSAIWVGRAAVGSSLRPEDRVTMTRRIVTVSNFVR
ncbi:MAG: hypothetical protein JJU36_09675 [Phycisphaeraceae bacterium]|nr:hypothetical protein [Phycisphaeraceae bacterium]